MNRYSRFPKAGKSARPPAGNGQTLWIAVEEGDHKYADKRTQEAIAAGIDPRVILDDGLFPGFKLQGDRFTAQIIFIPEMLITARAMKAGLTLIRPLLAAKARRSRSARSSWARCSATCTTSASRS